MKKALLLIGIIIGFCCCSCTKYCTCSVGTNTTNSSNIQEYEIGYNENCSDLSNANRTCL